jgi:hypothetical protein
MRYPDRVPIPLQALAIVKYPVSSWWGLYPQYYQPDMSEIAKAGIASFVNQGRINESSIKDKHPTWFERTFSIDFNVIDYKMASRGPTYMKMLWSWWPNLGFEPRYGGDIAFGAFATDGYMTFNGTFRTTLQILVDINNLTGNNTASLPENVTAMYNEANTYVKAAAESFRLGWYPLAKAQALDAAVRAEAVVNYIQLITPLKQTNQILVMTTALILAALLLSNLYWQRRLARLKRSIKHGRIRHKPRRKRQTRGQIDKLNCHSKYPRHAPG